MCHEVVSPDVVNRAELQASQRSQLEEASQRQPGYIHVRTVASGSISKLLCIVAYADADAMRGCACSRLFG
jgi:hypothetical protein